MKALSESHTAGPEELAKLDAMFVDAAAANNVPVMKTLRTAGASINAAVDSVLGAGVFIFNDKGAVSEPTGQTTALMAALHAGAFDAALYLATEGADATRVRKEAHDPEPYRAIKALDLLLTDHGQSRGHASFANLVRDGFDEKTGDIMTRLYETDLFTPAQREQLFDALVSHVKNPLDLVSLQTKDNAISWGRTEIIPKLNKIGVAFDDDDFLSAAAPAHRPKTAIATMETVLPYVSSINAENVNGQNAGHRTAGHADLDAFKWLESKGLRKDGYAGDVWPSTYAHAVGCAHSSIQSEDRVAARVAFARHLVDNGYPIDTPGRDGTTPVDVSISEGRRMDVALVYAKGGAALGPAHLSDAIYQTRFGRNADEPGQIVKLGEAMAEKGVLTEDALVGGYKTLFGLVAQRGKSVEQAGPIAEYFTSKGMSPQAAAARMVIEARNKSITTQLPHCSFLPVQIAAKVEREMAMKPPSAG